MTVENIAMAACDPASHDEIEAAGARAVVLGPAGELDRKLGPLDDLTLARWQGATHVVTSDVPGDPTSHSSVQMYLHDHGTRIGDRFGGTLWQIPPPPEPGPPAVFCLGLTKTATSTLAEALGVLGVRCYHWGGPPAWKAVVDALRAGELLTSRLPEGWDGYADIGSLLSRYRLLDLQYPGSRFIMTVRDEDAWVNSRRRHVERNRLAHASGRYHGTKLAIEEAGWRLQWQTHVTAVREYFAGRDDFLELDITKHPGWEELAAFLGVEVPDVPFPAANVDGRPSPGRYPTFGRTPAAGAADQQPPLAECPICGTDAARFESSGTIVARPNVRCPTCGSLERHRAMWIFLVDRTQVLERPGRALLIDADPLFDRLQRSAGFDVERITPVRSQQGPKGRIGRVLARGGGELDLPDLETAGRYELVIASHVLQKVRDDAGVLHQLRRVTAPAGGLLISVPTLSRPTDERRRRFTDPDQLRAYGNDGVLERRMVDAGFHVQVEDVPASIGAAAQLRFRLSRTELLRWATPRS